MATKGELFAEEDARWAEMIQILESLSPEQLEQPGYFREGWSVKDLISHICSWQAEAGQVLQQIRYGTYDPTPIDVDAVNRRFLEDNRGLPLPVVKSELWSARTRMVTELNALDAVTRDAEEWFRESGAVHYEEHLPRLAEWAEELRSR